MSLSRRQFLSGLAGAAGTAGTAGTTGTTGTPGAVQVAEARQAPVSRRGFGAPNLADDQVLRCVAGVRPFRKGGPRLERQDQAGKVIVHNYGHGGAGYTLSWGCATEAANALRGVRPGHADVAVLGSGVVGLTTARVLQERGFRVRIYAREFPPHTTSDVAGAEWSPDIVERGATPALRRRFEQMLVLSWHRFQSLVGSKWGVKRRPIFEAQGVPSGLDDLPPGLLPAPRHIGRLPFAPARSGRVYQTLLIEVPIFLARLVEQVGRGGAVLERRSFSAPAELFDLREPVIMNCLGLGAGAVFKDQAVVPIRGQLVHLRPQALAYLLDHPAGYLVPRSDALVLGGSFEEGVSEANPDPTICARILEDNRRFFGAS